MASTDNITADQLAEESSIKSVYIKYDNDRSTTLNKARDCARLTIPSVLVPDGHTEQNNLQDTYNSLGARAVNNLSSKLLLSLLPPSTPFFRLNPTDEVLAETTDEEGNNDELSTIEQQLSNLEMRVVSEIERRAYRTVVFEAFKSLIITGNALLLLEEGKMSHYKMDSYAVSRDFKGNAKDIILKEMIQASLLDESITTDLSEEDMNKDIEVYTRFYRNGESWISYQEVNDTIVEGSETTIKNEALPVIPLRWTKINGENYGRGLVEQYLGDFRSLEGLSQLLLEASSVSAQTIFGIRPGSVIEVTDLEEAGNGDVILGDLERDVTVLRVDKAPDLQVPLEMINDITRRLSSAFMLQSGSTRDSERTTALEVQFLARELEDSLGGIYSVISHEFQLPLVRLILDDLQYDIDNLTDISVVTGLESLGRNGDLQKLRELNGLIAEANPQYLQQYLQVDEYLKRMSTALGIQNVDSLFKTGDEVKQEQAELAQQQQQPTQTS